MAVGQSYDLTDFIRRDRNHPCVILWFVGNEIPDYRGGREAGGLAVRVPHPIG